MELWDAERKRLAKAVFNRPTRVLLAAWVLERGTTPFKQHEASMALAQFGAAPSAVVQELGRFVEWGMLEESRGGGNVMYGMLKQSPLWDVFRPAARVFGLTEE